MITNIHTYFSDKQDVLLNYCPILGIPTLSYNYEINNDAAVKQSYSCTLETCPLVLRPASVLHPAASTKHFVVFNCLLQIIYGVGRRSEDNKSVRGVWCPTEENFTVGSLTGWSK